METAEVDRSWTALVAPLLLVGLGAGCTFAPMAAEVMRSVPPRLSGAASGVNNALRQVGSVLAGAVIGAVLQTQLASSRHWAGTAAGRRGTITRPSHVSTSPTSASAQDYPPFLGRLSHGKPCSPATPPSDGT